MLRAVWAWRDAAAQVVATALRVLWSWARSVQGSAARRDRLAVLAAAWLAGLLVCAVLPGLVAADDPLRQDVTLTRLLEGPSGDHWLGTDRYGRDLWSRVVWGARPAVTAIVIGLGLSAGLGVPVGLCSGWVGGWADRAVMWLVDVVFSLPLVLVAMAVATATGTGLVPAMAVVGLLLVTRFARLTRGLVLAEREALYVDAARVTGLRPPTVLARYVLPNIAAPIIVQAAIIAGAVLLIGAVLSFVGVGSAPDSYDWGAMLNQARREFVTAPWQVVPPAAAIVATVVAFNLLAGTAGDSTGRGPSHPGRAPRPTRRHRLLSPAGADDDKSGTDGPLLSLRDLTVYLPPDRDGESVTAVDGVSLDVRRGETLGIVGESGAGKSITMLAALGLAPPGVLVTGSVRFQDRELTGLSDRDWGSVRGDQIGVIWQDPLGALNPTRTIGAQVAEPLVLHRQMSRLQARQRAVDLLGMVQLPDPERLAGDFPYQLSGGMAQRVGIAAALACEPDLLIADEPTTALDVTVQGQVLDLLADLKEQLGMTMVLVTHDLGVIADTADRVAVFYAGEVVETAATSELFAQPRHPYTWSLLEAMPHNQAPGGPLTVIGGPVPVPGDWPTGCRFAPRCGFATADCAAGPPPLTVLGPGRSTRCARAGDLADALDRRPTSLGRAAAETTERTERSHG